MSARNLPRKSLDRARTGRKKAFLERCQRRIDVDGTARNDVVYMRVILQLPPPGVQNAEEATATGTEVAGVFCERFDGLGGGSEERTITHFLVGAKHATQGLGHGKRQHKMWPWKLPLDLAIQPCKRLGTLAGWAVAIAATGGGHMPTAALTTGKADGAERAGSTVDDGVDHLPM